MKLYICFYSLGSNYFGVGTTKQKAYTDFASKWLGDEVHVVPASDCCYFELLEVK